MATSVVHSSASPTPTRRDFMHVAAGGLGAVGVAALAWPIIDSMNPSSDVLALSVSEIDLAPVQPGQRITVVWRGRPVFVVRRTAEAIARAEADDGSPDLLDPATDGSRVQDKQWLIVVGVCTHLGCVPLGQKPADQLGPYGGWFCPCHGSIYDTSGRVRRGPAPRNLEVPPYTFIADSRVRIG